MATYLILLVLARKTWDNMAKSTEITGNHPGVSIVIAARNEEKNIAQLVRSLYELKYPKEKIEIIIVDDDSHDRTLEVLRYETAEKPWIRWLALKDAQGFQGSFKKRALTAGFESAKFSILVTTDADCQFHPLWLNALIGPIQKDNLVMSVGPVAYLNRGVVSHLLDIELASLVAVGAVSLNRGYPNMCNGANLAFIKEAFKKVNGYKGYENVISGDDEFLLYKIFKQYPKQVGFSKNTHAVVQTEPPANFKEFINQRKRWSSKWKIHQSNTTKALAVFVFIFHLSLIIAVVMTVLGQFSWKLLLLLLGIKVFLEYYFVSPVLGFLGKKVPLSWFFFMQVVYSFYATLIGFVTQFTGFTWKNRRYS